MKILLKTSIFLILSIFMVAGTAMAYTIDGSVSDWGIDLASATSETYLDHHFPTGGNDVDLVTEDNTDSSNGWVQVGPGWSDGNTYDAEAMYFDNDALYGYIAIITGLPSDNSPWAPGDIGISVVGSATTDPELVDDGGVSYDPVKTTVYEFGISMDGYLSDVSQWESVHYDGSPNPDFSVSDPWAIYSTTSLQPVDFAYSTNGGDLNDHYVIETKFLLTDLDLTPGSELDIHWTMECGNDYLNLHADVNPVPEPATMLLFGTGLIGLAGLGRKKFSRN